MRIIFWGTPQFSVPSLKILIDNKHTIEAVVTVPDKERGRGQKLMYSAVKEYALEKKIPILQPEILKSDEFISELKNYNSELFVVVAFKILPREIFTLPKYGSFNLHASLLPKYRGAAPIQWALINGDTETGVTTFALEEKVDTGNIYLQKKIQIMPDDNFGSLHDKLSILGAEAVIETVAQIEAGKAELKPQNAELATPAPKITKEIMRIDWNKSAEEVHNLIRAFSPHPGAYFNYEGKLIKVFRSKVDYSQHIPAASVLQRDERLFFGCGSGTLEVMEIQIEGRKKMNTAELLRGFSFSKN